MTSKFVWVIAGGVMQIPLMEEIKSRGLKVFCTDGNPQCPGADIADQFVPVDTYDVFAHLDLASNMTDKPIAVLTAGADVGPTVSAVADELNLPAVDYEIAKRVRNKGSMREALQARHPAYRIVPYSDDTPHSLWAGYCRFRGIEPYPCVVKPLESAGSRGVTLVESPWDFTGAILRAKTADKGMNRHYIVEKLLYGPEIASDWFVIDGEVKFATAVYRKFSRKIFGLEVAHVTYDPPRDVRDMVKVAAISLGVNWGPLKVDFIKDTEHGWTITECATRLSGGFDHMYAAPLATGKDITGFMLDMVLGEKPNIKKLWNTKKKYACVYSPVLAPGIEVNKLNVDAEQVFITKDVSPEIADCSDRSLFYITTGETACEAYRRAKVIKRDL